MRWPAVGTSHRKRQLRGIVRRLFRAQRSVYNDRERQWLRGSCGMSANHRDGLLSSVRGLFVRSGWLVMRSECPIAGPSSRVSSIRPVPSHSYILHVFQNSCNNLVTWWTIVLDIIVIMREGLNGGLATYSGSHKWALQSAYSLHATTQQQRQKEKWR